MKLVNSQHRSAFTIIELVVVVAVLAVGAAVLSPALAGSKPDTRAVQCRNNMRTLQVAQQMYASDHKGRLVGNAMGLAMPAPGSGNWVGGWMDWGNGMPTGSNTNLDYLVKTPLGPYFKSDARLFKCPADVFRSNAGPRARSYSMNGFVGGTTMRDLFSHTTYRIYLKDTDFVGPGETFTVIDEHPDSINDGLFVAGMPSGSWPAQAPWTDLPASQHQDGASLSFFDGHVVTHKWTDPTTLRPVSKTFSPLGTSLNDSRWLVQRASAPF
ncbi:MAG TPA: prepilin-type N-terminal cleavage/methylation domain-containing protein [Clostridia bacterium]|nr:prepilin-type N-terminal cleavage/methylation domain-containing protein [Clostridia bacterium]